MVSPILSPRRRWGTPEHEGRKVPLSSSETERPQSSQKEQTRKRTKGWYRTIPLLLPAFLFGTILRLRPSSFIQDMASSKTYIESPVYDVIIVGAGVAGLTAAFNLERHGGGLDQVKILEASDVWGGRIERDDTFVDFPVSLGGTFLFDKRTPRLIAEIEKKEEVDLKQRFHCDYMQLAVFKEVGKSKHRLEIPGEECMWVNNNSWYDYFADYIAPKSLDKIVYGCQVDRVHYHQHGSPLNDHLVTVACGKEEYRTKYAIVTVPLAILQDGDIHFSPPLPKSITSKKKVYMWQGFKILLEFKKKFFPDTFYWEDENEEDAEDSKGESFFFDYSIFQKSNRTVLGAYFIGEPAKSWLKLKDDTAIFQRLMKRLDVTFGGQASKYYVKHKVVNWSNKPYIRGIYANKAMELGPYRLGNQVFLAGEAFPLDKRSYGWVHGAAFSGTSAAHSILKLEMKNAGARVVEHTLENYYSLPFKYDELRVDKTRMRRELASVMPAIL